MTRWERWLMMGIVAAALAAMLSISVVTGQPLAADGAASLRLAESVPWTWPTPDGSGRMVLDNLVTVDPAGGVAAYPAGDALERARRADYQPRAETRVTLRRATYLDHYRDRLVWLIEYARDPMYLGGPPWLSTQDRVATLHSGVCEFVLVMDASVDAGTYRYDRTGYNILSTLQVCWLTGASLIGGTP